MLKYLCRLRNLINLNSGFYKDLDTNFEQACELSEKKFSHKELVGMLESGNIPQKQIAALRLDYIENQQEANLLLNNLIGCDGKIREAVALRINRFLFEKPSSANYFATESAAQIFANATIDINANICRLVVESVSVLTQNVVLANVYLDKILKFINETFSELDKFIFRDKKYVINKQLFKLYWCLEALKLFVNEVDKATLTKFVTRTDYEREYTIREKAAQIISVMGDDEFAPLRDKLKNDENYYVRNVFKS